MSRSAGAVGGPLRRSAGLLAALLLPAAVLAAPADPAPAPPADRLVDDGAMSATIRPPTGLFLAVHGPRLTTMASLDLRQRTLHPVLSRETGELAVSLAADRLAYLVRHGVNPARNHVEIVDLRRGRVQRLEAAPNVAVLGFALSATGEHLAYAGMDLGQSRSHHVAWRIALADLERGAVRSVLTARPEPFPRQAIPVPFGWSRRTGEILLRAVVPFQGMATLGLWSLRPDIAGLRLALPEPAYTAAPQLSPDGGSLAYLAVDMESLPRLDIPRPGPPPGNVLMVRDLTSGESTTWTREREATLSVLGWSEDGRHVLVSRQAWSDGRVRDTVLLRVGPGGAVRVGQATPPATVADGLDCRGGSVFWVEEDGARAAVRGADGAGVPATYLTVADGRVRLLRCPPA